MDCTGAERADQALGQNGAIAGEREPHRPAGEQAFAQRFQRRKAKLPGTIEPGRRVARGVEARQLYTHILIIDSRSLDAVAGQPFVIYHNALALGHLFYQLDPAELLEPIELPGFHAPLEPAAWLDRARKLDLPALEPLRERLLAGRPVRFSFAGDRTVLAECLIGSLGPGGVTKISFATSLQPSSDRPFILSLVDNRKQKS